MAWVYAVNHFGEGYAKVDKEDLVIKTNKSAKYQKVILQSSKKFFAKKKNLSDGSEKDVFCTFEGIISKLP